jgi:DNA transformation protein
VAVSKSLVAHALDLLAPAGEATARAMFGGYGVYLDGVMCCLLDDEQLYLKADDQSRPAFLARGCKRWVYPSPNGPMETDYFAPPDETLDDPEKMLPWAREALAAALRKRAAKGSKGRAAKRAAAGEQPVAAQRPAAKKGTANKGTANKGTAKKGTANKAIAKKAAANKAAAKKAAAKKGTAKKATAARPQRPEARRR